MPQFELEGVGPSEVSGLHRGRTPEEAVEQAAGLSPTEGMEVEEEEDLQGWRQVRVGGEPAGRVRVHQRMRFRRD